MPRRRRYLPVFAAACGLLWLCACAPGPESQYRSAEGLLARGRTQMAREKLESLVAAYPDFATAALTLGRLHLQRQDYLAADKYLSQGLARAPEDFANWIQLARARLQLSRYAEAGQALAAALQCARGPLEPLMARRWIAEASRLDDLAARAAAAKARMDVSYILKDADLVEMINLQMEMVECFTHLNLPDRVEAAWNQVFLYGNTRIQELEARLRVDPADLSQRMQLASALLSAAKRWAVVRKNQVQMEQYLLRADPLLGSVIALATETPALRAEAAAGAVSLYLMRNRLDDAQLWIDNAVAWDPAQPAYLFTRAQVLDRRDKREQALPVMRAYLAAASPTAGDDAWLFYAQLLRGSGRMQEALEAVEAAVARASGEFRPAFVRAQLLAGMGQTAAARRAVAELARRDLYPPEMKELHELEQALVKLEPPGRSGGPPAK